MNSRPRSLHLTSSRVAVVHDWLTGMRGGEKVLEAILELYPGADLYTLFHFPGSVSPAIEEHPIHTSRLQRMAAGADDYRRLLPLFPSAVSGWKFDHYDLVISSSHCVAKGVETGGVPHVCYCHTPMRYVWDRFDDYFPARRPLLRFAAATVAPHLRNWDVRTAAGVDRFVANSSFVRERIRRYYDRDSEVVHPFVDDVYLAGPLRETREPYHLVVSALVPYKKVDLAIAAAGRGRRDLVVVGSGPQAGELRAAAGPNVRFPGFVSPEELRSLLAGAQSLILSGVEDFGITCIEAMAAGTPVVALREGGALDSVIDGETGIFFTEATVGSLLDAMERAERMSWDRARIREHASRFSRERFQREFSKIVAEAVQKHR
jgi:glycosyltransferase involved in cell wall biosynthesis